CACGLPKSMVQPRPEGLGIQSAGSQSCESTSPPNSTPTINPIKMIGPRACPSADAVIGLFADGQEQFTSTPWTRSARVGAHGRLFTLNPGYRSAICARASIEG